MYIADHYTAKALHQADLITAEHARQKRRGHRVTSSPNRVAAMVSAIARRFGPRRPTPFDRSFEITAGLSDARLQLFETHFDLRRVESGEQVGAQGAVVEHFGLVLAGRLGVSIDDEPVAVLEPGSHYGSLALLYPVDNAVHKVSLHALETGLVATAAPDRFHDLIGEFPSVHQHVRNIARRRRAYFRTRAVTPEPVRYPVTVG